MDALDLGAVDTLSDSGACLSLAVAKDRLDPAWESRPADLDELAG